MQPAKTQIRKTPRAVQIGTTSLALSLIAINRALVTAGLRKPVDGWRRSAGLMLRKSPAKFVLSAFNLATGLQPGTSIESASAALTTRLDQFLKSYQAAHLRLKLSRLFDIALPHTGPTYSIEFTPQPAGPQKFLAPDFVNHPTDDSNLLEFIFRISADAASTDVWMRVNHVATDGVPMQELLSGLEQSWGLAAPALYPAAEEFTPHEAPRPVPTRDDLADVQCFINFAPLLAWRKQMNAALPKPMTVAAAFLWRLAHIPHFANLHFATTVEVAPTKHFSRGVNLIVIRPKNHLDQPTGLAAYVTQFNQVLEQTRTRTSASAKLMDNLALLPVKLHLAVLKQALERAGEKFGSLGLTFIKDAKVFTAPISEVGYPAGFIAIGNIDLPTPSTEKVGSVQIKAPKQFAANYPTWIRQAINAC